MKQDTARQKTGKERSQKNHGQPGQYIQACLGLRLLVLKQNAYPPGLLVWLWDRFCNCLLNCKLCTHQVSFWTKLKISKYLHFSGNVAKKYHEFAAFSKKLKAFSWWLSFKLYIKNYLPYTKCPSSYVWLCFSHSSAGEDKHRSAARKPHFSACCLPLSVSLH